MKKRSSIFLIILFFGYIVLSREEVKNSKENGQIAYEEHTSYKDKLVLKNNSQNIIKAGNVIQKQKSGLIVYKKAMELGEKVKHFDQHSLNEARREFRALLSRNIESSEELVLSLNSGAVDMDIEGLFFILESFIEIHPAPLKTVVEFFQQESLGITDNHHHGVSHTQKNSMTKAYFVDKLIQKNNALQFEDKKLISQFENALIKTIKEKKDLMLVRHSISKLKDIYKYTPTELKKALSNRSPKERFAYSDLLIN